MTTAIQLGTVVKFRKGKKAAEVHETAISGARPYIQIDEVRGVPPQKYARDRNGVEVEQRDICIVWDGANAGTVGFGLEGIIGSTVARMRVSEPEKWDTRFIGRLLQSKFVELNSHAQARGATIPHVDKNKLDAIELPMLPPEEQRRIADLLDKAGEVGRKLNGVIALSESLLKSSYVHLVGHLNPDYAGWEPFTIEELAAPRKGAIRSGPFGSALRHGEFVDEGVAVLGIDNAVQNRFAWGERRYISEEKYRELQRYRVFPDDVIITIMGTTGRSAVVPSDIPVAITTKHLATISCNTELVLPEVLSFAIHSDPMVTRQIQSRNKGAIMDGLNLGIIRDLILKLPPLDAQQRFVSVMKTVRRMADQIDSQTGAGSALFGSLSQRAFRGEL